MRNLSDATVVVTGAGSGIGRATAIAFAGEGARVHVVDLNKQRADDTVAAIEASGGTATPHAVDVADIDQVVGLADTVAAQGRIDILHNNAGIAHTAPIQETTLDDWRDVLDVNLWGVIHGIHAFLPHLLAQGGESHIVNTASMLGLFALPEVATYCTSKFAVAGLSESLAIELAPKGINVTAICPGIVNTNIVRDGRMTEDGERARASVEKIYERGVQPERVAADVLAAVAARRLIQPSPWWQVSPVWWIKRLSPSLYRWAAGKLAAGALGKISSTPRAADTGR